MGLNTGNAIGTIAASISLASLVLGLLPFVRVAAAQVVNRNDWNTIAAPWRIDGGKATIDSTTDTPNP